MRMERINEHQVRCVITPADLQAHKLTTGDLKYGSRGTRALFNEVMDRASTEYRFNEEHLPVMIEAVPLKDGELLVILSAVENAEELDPHFAHFQEETGEEEAEEKGEKGFRQPEAPQVEPVVVFRFADMAGVIRFCESIRKLPISTSLYRMEGQGFFLSAEALRGADLQDFQAVRNRLEEFHPSEERSAARLAWLKEHAKLLLTEPHLFLSGK